MSIQHFQTKLGITKYSIVTNSNDSVTLRLMTEHDLAMLYEWLNRSHIVEWWGGEEARPTLADVQEQYLPSVLAQESVTPYIAMLNGEPIGYAQSYVALGSGDGWWEEETDPGVRGIDQLLANASQLGKGLGTKLVRALVELLFNDPEVTKIQTDPSPSNLRAIRCYEKAGFERQGTVTTPDGPAVYMVQTRQAFERTRSVGGGRPRAGALGRPSCQTLGRMDTTQVTLIHKILAAADERNLPLWIGGGWAIDARLGRVTRKHDDIDLTFPGERRGELEAIVEMLGGRVMEELDYGFLAEIGDELLDCEPAWWADEAYEIAEAPQGSCPEAAEGVIAGRPVRCNSWEAIIWDYFYYADEVPPVDWPTKHIESYRLACTSLGAEKVEVLRAAFRSRYAA